MVVAAVVWILLAAPPASARPSDADCMSCHSDKDLKSGQRSLFVEEAPFKASVHGSFGCVDCHEGIQELPHAEKLRRVACASCHGDVSKEYAASVHGKALKAGAGDAATCRSCHGGPHEILPGSDPASKVARRNLPDTCGACHADPDFLSRHKIPFARPVEAYRLSVHGRAAARGVPKAASCSDCHGSHNIVPGKDPRSKINHWKVAETCGNCHAEIETAFERSVHGEAMRRGSEGAPVCTGCHGEHAILAPTEVGSLVNPTRVAAVTCGRCHTDERLLARYGLSSKQVDSFQDSYHGLALKSGRTTVANCASCHGVHNILNSRDPRSSIHADNLAKTCGACHPGAGQRFAIGKVHVGAPAEHAVVRLIRLGYYILIPATLAFMLFHNFADLLVKLVRRRVPQDSGERVTRMNRRFRLAHGLVVVSFLTLIVTGFALKFPDAWWARPLVAFEGGQWPLRGLVHRIAAAVLLFASAYHVFHLVTVPRDRVILPALLPKFQDAKDLLAMFRHFFKADAPRPHFGMFSYAEKMEYWAFWWGNLVMAASGFVLWFSGWSLTNLPKWVTDAATAVHWYEAILATASIAIWHWYAVIFDPDVYPLDTAAINGKVPADHLKHTRPEYYRWILAEREERKQFEGD